VGGSSEGAPGGIHLYSLQVGEGESTGGVRRKLEVCVCVCVRVRVCVCVCV
jgi:hypothetical protein